MRSCLVRVERARSPELTSPCPRPLLSRVVPSPHANARTPLAYSDYARARCSARSHSQPTSLRELATASSAAIQIVNGHLAPPQAEFGPPQTQTSRAPDGLLVQTSLPVKEKSHHKGLRAMFRKRESSAFGVASGRVTSAPARAQADRSGRRSSLVRQRLTRPARARDRRRLRRRRCWYLRLSRRAREARGPTRLPRRGRSRFRRRPPRSRPRSDRPTTRQAGTTRPYSVN